MGYSISDAVTSVLDEMRFLHVAFKHDVVNYSALARLIKPLVEEKLGSPAGLDAIIMGIRRYADAMPADELQNDLVSLVKDCTMTLRTDLAAVHVKHWRSENFLVGVNKLLTKEVDWYAGEKIYVTMRSNEMSLYMSRRFLPEVLELVGKDEKTKLLESRESMALISIGFPHPAVDPTVLVAFFSNQFAHSSIVLQGAFSTRHKVTFLFDEQDASKAYDVVSRAISTSRSLHKSLQASGERPEEPAVQAAEERVLKRG